MNKMVRFWAVFVVSGGIFFAFHGHAQENASRDMIVVADWGDKGPSQEIIDTVARYPSLRLVVAWPSGLKPSDRMLSLVRARRIEPVMTLSNEPILPLLAGAWASSSAVSMGWPEDVRDIIARDQETYRKAFGRLSAGLYLRSGIFSSDVISFLSGMGVHWAVVPSHSNNGGRLFISRRFLVVAPHRADAVFSLPEWLASRREKNVVLLYDAAHRLTVEQLVSLGKMQGTNSSPRTILPRNVLTESPQFAVATEILPFVDEDIKIWTQNPLPWERVMLARQALDEYKNSGQANPRTMELAREELYHLYRYDTLRAVQTAEHTEAEQKFLAGVSNVYRLIGRSAPDESVVAAAAAGPLLTSGSTMRIDTRPDSVVFTVPAPGNRALSIRRFSVSITSATVTYIVDLSSAVLSGDFLIDVYMDLNNLRNAGLTRFLPGVEGFLQDENAWEYALRFDRYQASLYRVGRYEALLTKTFRISRRFEVSIPRDILRGTPLNWGYQVITLEKKNAASPWRVNDFLAQDAPTRSRLSQQSPLQLPAFRNH